MRSYKYSHIFYDQFTKERDSFEDFLIFSISRCKAQFKTPFI